MNSVIRTVINSRSSKVKMIKDPPKQKINEKLATTFAGVKMRSPVGVGPMNIPRCERSYVTPERHVNVMMKHVDAGAGFLYIPGFDYISDELIKELLPKAAKRDPLFRPSGARIVRIKSPDGTVGLMHLGMTSTPAGCSNLATFDLVRKTLDMVKKQLPPDVPLIGAHTPLGSFPESSALTAKKAEELGLDMLEVNFGCGFITGVEHAVDYYLERKFPLLMGGPLVCEHFDLVENIVKAAAKAVRIPIGVKITTEVGFPRVIDLARRIKNAGAKYIEVQNFAPTIAPPDIYNHGKTTLPHVEGNPFIVAHGGLLRPSCYKNVAAVSKFAPGLEVAASGGLLSPENVVEVMMLGAGMAELVTGILTQGRNLLRRTIDFLNNYVDEQGYKSIQEIIGLGVQYIEPVEKVEIHAGKLKAEVDPEKCKNAGVCTDHICIAMTRDDNGKAKVIPEACDGCGLCVDNCPNGAIKVKYIG